MPGDCCECGACCFSKSDSYVPVTTEDKMRLGEDGKIMTRKIAGSYYLTMQDGHCAQLQHLEGDWVCSIYKNRPLVCRQLERGSPACMAERVLKRRTAIIAAKRLLTIAR